MADGAITRGRTRREAESRQYEEEEDWQSAADAENLDSLAPRKKKIKASELRLNWPNSAWFCLLSQALKNWKEYGQFFPELLSMELQVKENFDATEEQVRQKLTNESVFCEMTHYDYERHCATVTRLESSFVAEQARNRQRALDVGLNATQMAPRIHSPAALQSANLATPHPAPRPDSKIYNLTTKHRGRLSSLVWFTHGSLGDPNPDMFIIVLLMPGSESRLTLQGSSEATLVIENMLAYCYPPVSVLTDGAVAEDSLLWQHGLINSYNLVVYPFDPKVPPTIVSEVEQEVDWANPCSALTNPSEKKVERPPPLRFRCYRIQSLRMSSLVDEW